MGIGRQQARALINAVRAGTTSRKQLREQLGEAIDILQSKINGLDVQFNAAEKDFAASKQSQFNTFVDGLTEPPTDQTP